MPMATWHKIQIDQKEHPPSRDVGIGDVIQCYINFALTPGSFVKDIVVSISNGSLARIGVAITSDFSMAGGGQMSAFFFVYGDLTGRDELCTLRLIPVIPGQVAQQHEITFKVPPVEP